MSNLKRKAPEKSASKPKSLENTAKKHKTSHAKNDDNPTRNLPVQSILVEEEKTFPRGRGTDLTPIERKQIKLRADRDVLFEEGGKRPPGRTTGDEDFDEEDELEPEEPPTKRRKNKNELRQENARKREAKTVKGEELPKPTGLKLGDIVDARVLRINDDDYDRFLTLEWLGNRRGVIPVTGISTHLTKALETLLKDEDEEDGDEGGSSQPELKKYFKKGQPLRAAVTRVIESSHDTSGKTTKGRLELTVDPRQVNNGMTKSSLTQNAKVQAAVESVEDHGIIMDLGFEDGVKGFIAATEIPPGRKMTHMRPGMVLLCIYVGSSANGKVAKLTCNHSDLADTKQERQPNLGLKHKQFTNPVDEELTSLDSLIPGYQTKARITSVKDTQLNVVLADGVQGRVDVSEAFASLEDIRDRKHPMRAFHKKQVLPVRVLGIHDARNHRFLPISHRGGHVPVFELSARLGGGDSIMSFDQLKVGESYLASVNNVSGSNLWVNLSPIVRGRIERMDLPEDVSDISTRFPVGAALRVWVKNMDLANNRLDVSTRPLDAEVTDLKSSDVSEGMILPGRVTKVDEYRLFVQLSSSVAGVVPLTEIADDFDEANPNKYTKNEMVRVCVVEVDQPNKRITLSARPSKVLSSSLPVKDKQITNFKDLKKGDLVRGFIQKVDDIGLFISIGHGVKALAPIAELSDSFVKDWKPLYQVDKLVQGCVIELDADKKRVHLSLKESALESGYKPVLRFEDMQKDDVVTGRVRKVEEYGVFIVVDHSRNVSGLCHRSQIADRKVEDPRTLYNEGDAVTAIVTSVDDGRRRIGFSLKASAFEKPGVLQKLKEMGKEPPTIEVDLSDEEEHEGRSDSEAESDSSEAGVDLPVDVGGHLNLLSTGIASDADLSDSDGGATTSRELPSGSEKRDDNDLDDGLDAGGFNWNLISRKRSPSVLSDGPSEPDFKKKRRKRAEPWEDHTADVNEHGPQSAADFERLLMAERDDPDLWRRYVLYHVAAGDIPAARKIAERATKSISITLDQEKLEVWTLWINLELLYGEDTGDVGEEAMNRDTTGALNFLRDVAISGNVKEVYAKACAVNDRAALSERLTRNLTKFGKLDAAMALYNRMSHDKALTPNPSFWIKYATFLMRDADPQQPQEARALVPRATQILPEREHARILMEFARLEFTLRPGAERKSGAGDPERGRTLFTELLSAQPKRFDFWDIWLSLEESLLQSIDEKDRDAWQDQEDRVRDLFERQTGEGAPKMKKKRAETVFGRWLKFEEDVGKDRGEMERAKRVDRVKARERRWRERRERKSNEKV